MKAANLMVGGTYLFTGNGSSFKVVYEGVRVAPMSFAGEYGFDLVICTAAELAYVAPISRLREKK